MQKGNDRKRLLVIVAGQGSLNYMIRSGLVFQLKSFCEPVIGIIWEQPDLQKELMQQGIEMYVMPAFEPSPAYLILRNKLNDWYYKKVLRSVSTKIEQRYIAQRFTLRKKLSKRKAHIMESFNRTFRPGYIQTLKATEQKLIQEQAGYKDLEKWLSAINIDACFTATPFILSSELIGRFAHVSGKPAFAAICSFDNVTKRGWPAFMFDHYIVWNKYNQAELQRIFPTLQDKDITITGAPQFDAHVQKTDLLNREAWLASKGLPGNKRIILYSGGPAKLFPNETQYLRHLREALESGDIENAVILFRSHPLDKMQRWKDEVGLSTYIFYDHAPTGNTHPDFTNLREQDILNLLATLKFTDVHINLCSTMTVDGSFFNKPQIAPYYDIAKPARQQKLRNMYEQEHFMPILTSKALHFARSKKNLVQLVNACLENPEKFMNGHQQCLQEIITYTDGKSAERVALTLQKLLDT